MPTSTPTRSASTRGSAPTPTSSTCSAGARSRCRLAAPRDGLPFGVTFIAPVPQRCRARRASASAGNDACPAARRDRRTRRRAPRARPARARGPRARRRCRWPSSARTCRGMPLNGQLTERGATLRRADAHGAALSPLRAARHDAAEARAACAVERRRAAIAVEVWDMPRDARRLVPRADPGAARSRHASSWPTAARARLSLRSARPRSARATSPRYGGWRATISRVRAAKRT